MTRHRVTAVGEATTLADRKRRAGQRLVIGLPRPWVDPLTRSLVRELRPAGFILFARNVEEPAQVRELNRELAALLPPDLPPLRTVDQEGGRVQRVREGATAFPPLAALGRADRPGLLEAHARALAREVAAMGFDLDWAPVADVATNPHNPVIGDRAFGSDPRRVAELVGRWVRAFQAEGVAACAKHFPGHGDTAADSHEELPVDEREAPEIEELALPPFAAAVEAGAATVMTAHVRYPAWDEERPATMSERILRGLLREELGHRGVLVSDDLEMKAVRGRFPLARQLREACAATVDLFLVCSDPDLQVAAYETLVRLQEEDPAQDLLAEDSLRRLEALRLRFLASPRPRPGLEVLACPEHRALAAEIARIGGA